MVILKNGQASQEISLEKIFEGFLKASMDGFFIVDSQGRFKEANQTFCDLVGYSRSELLGMSIPDIEARETPQRTQEHIAEIVSSGKARFETAHRHRDGHVIEVEVSVTFLEIDSRRFLLAFVRDLTETKKSERQIEARDSLLRLFIETSSLKEYLEGVAKVLRDWSGCTGVAVEALDEEGHLPCVSNVGFPIEFGAQDRRLSDIKEQCACVRAITKTKAPQDRLLLTEAGSFYFDDMEALVNALPEADRAEVRSRCIHSQFASAGVIPIHYGEKTLGILHLVDSAKGRIIPETVRFIELITPLIGEGMHRFTLEEELKRNYDAQSAINSLLQLSLQNFPIARILERALDLVLSVPWLSFESRGSIFLVEDEPEILVMRAQRGISDPLVKECRKVPFGTCICGRAASSGELQFSSFLDNAHETRYEGMEPHGHYCVPIKVSGQVLGVMNIYLKEGHRRSRREVEFLTAVANTLAGIIARRKAELEIHQLNENLERRVRERTAELEKANWELEAFSSRVSHDLRTPLINIALLSQNLLKKSPEHLDPQALQTAKNIRTETENILHLTDQLLSLSRIQYQEFKPSQINMDELLHGVLEQLQFLASHRVIEWKIQPLPPFCGDPTMVRQVLLNLFSNAIKYTKKNPVAVIEVGGRAEGNRSLYYVKDNGIGFDNQNASRLFEAFKRFDPSGEFEGTGIGLSIVQRVIEKHGGAVWAEGAVGKGAVFHFALPSLC